jgi:protease-4
LPIDAVDKIGKGRVWSGSQAKGLGLVDELGGTDRAIEVAKQLAHIPASDPVRLVRLPEEKTFFQQLLEREKEQMSESESLQATLQHILGLMEPVQARLPYELHIK